MSISFVFFPVVWPGLLSAEKCVYEIQVTSKISRWSMCFECNTANNWDNSLPVYTLFFHFFICGRPYVDSLAFLRQLWQLWGYYETLRGADTFGTTCVDLRWSSPGFTWRFLLFVFCLCCGFNQGKWIGLAWLISTAQHCNSPSAQVRASDLFLTLTCKRWCVQGVNKISDCQRSDRISMYNLAVDSAALKHDSLSQAEYQLRWHLMCIIIIVRLHVYFRFYRFKCEASASVWHC